MTLTVDGIKKCYLFIQERRLYMYVKYCENKPKSEFLVAEYFEYFEVTILTKS